MRHTYGASPTRITLKFKSEGCSTTTVGRPTELAAIILMAEKYIPGFAYTGDLYAVPSRYVGQQVIDIAHLEEYNQRGGVKRKRCGNCKFLRPATREYFKRNLNGKNGLHSICKECESEAYFSRKRKDIRAA